MTTENSSNLASRRKLRSEKMKAQKLEEIVSIMDARGISVSDIQQYLEQKKNATTTYDAVLSKRKKRRANQARRKALRLAQQKSPANKPKKDQPESDNDQRSGATKRSDNAKSKQTAKGKTTKSKSSGENGKQTNRQAQSRVN